MGYNPSPSMVKRYVHYLQHIESMVSEEREARFTFPAEALGRERDRMHAILKSAERFTTEFDGRFAYLRNVVQVSVDWDQSLLIVRPKRASIKPLSNVVHPNEYTALEEIALVPSDHALHVLKFRPTPNFNLATFESQLGRLGWTIRVQEDDPGDPDDPFIPIPARKAGELDQQEAPDGWLIFTAVCLHQPEKKETGFGLLKGGFTQVPKTGTEP